MEPLVCERMARWALALAVASLPTVGFSVWDGARMPEPSSRPPPHVQEGAGPQTPAEVVDYDVVELA